MSVNIISGRRKCAIARVQLKDVKDGQAQIIVNGKDYKEYFPTTPLQYIVEQAFALTETTGQYTVVANMSGGGIKGQAEALRLAVSKTLIGINETFRPVLKANGLVRRDPRMVERKKPGRPKARKRFQFSKR